jgi:hypothetical protein
LNKKKRVKFARKWKKHDFSNILWTDETDFPLIFRPNPQNTRQWDTSPDNVDPAEVVHSSPKLKVWGGMSAKGTTELIFYEGRLGAVRYRDDILPVWR